MDLVIKYFSNLSKKQIEQFESLEALYTHWNSKINLISRKDISELYLKHILHSLSIAKVIDFSKNTKILDVGTGGGFPGIPLAILYPDVDFLLVDSIGKKINVVRCICAEIGLSNVKTLHERAENINETFDFVVSRAVTKMADFQELVVGKFNKVHNNSINNGIIYLKGGDLSEELQAIPHVQYLISDFFEESFFKTKKIIYIEN